MDATTSTTTSGDAPVVGLDLRDALRSGRNPLAKILAAVRKLRPREVLCVRTTFAPVALIELLESQGFAHHLSSEHDGDWSVWFWRPEGASRFAVQPGPRRAPQPHIYSILARRFRNRG